MKQWKKTSIEEYGHGFSWCLLKAQNNQREPVKLFDIAQANEDTMTSTDVIYLS